MAKFLVRLDKNTNEFVDMQSVDREYAVKFFDTEDLPYKEGFIVVNEYDKNQNKVISRYEELPKTETQILHEEIEKLKRAMAENAPNTGELDTLKASKRLSKENLSELDNL